MLEWQGLSRSIDLRARDIRFLDLDDDLAVALPEVSVKLSVRALLRGVVAPTVIEIREAFLYLVRQEDGTIHLEYATEAPADGTDPGRRGGRGPAGLFEPPGTRSGSRAAAHASE